MNDKEFEVWKAAYIAALKLFIEGKLSYRDGVLSYANNAVHDYRNADRNFTRRSSA
jgi:hypothetical protein